jgi:hypothetical protein
VEQHVQNVDDRWRSDYDTLRSDHRMLVDGKVALEN